MGLDVVARSLQTSLLQCGAVSHTHVSFVHSPLYRHTDTHTQIQILNKVTETGVLRLLLYSPDGCNSLG